MALFLVGPAVQAQDTMAGMSGHAHVTIPPGALYTVADVEFMQGMIAHHAQAIAMSRMAAGHRADPRVLKLANKIDQSQVAEIRIMQEWLTRNGQTAPDTSSWHGGVGHGRRFVAAARRQARPPLSQLAIGDPRDGAAGGNGDLARLDLAWVKLASGISRGTTLYYMASDSAEASVLYKNHPEPAADH